MGANVEVNDVDISRLFNWGRVFEVVNPVTKEVEALVYMRLLGDADVNRARVYALRKVGELNRKLSDPESDESYALIKSKDEVDKEDLINYIIAYSMRGIINRAYKEVTVKKPVEPKSNASVSKMAKYQAEVDAYPEKYGEAISKFLKKETEKLKADLGNSNKDELYKEYKKTLVEEFGEMEAMRAYNDMEIYLGCYKDDSYTTKFFDNFEQYDNLDSAVKQEFRAAYNSLQMGMEELKKLREATR